MQEEVGYMWTHLISFLTPHFPFFTLTTPTHNKHTNTKSTQVKPTPPTTTMTTAITVAEPELKTYWCHECDMSVSLTTSHTPSPLLCPHCDTHFLELMDSPFSQNDADSSSIFDVVFQDALLLLTPPPPKPHTSPILPTITVTQTLLTVLDPSNGVVLCAVCKETVSVDEEAKQLPCDHLYHVDCITPWLRIRSSCPLCRCRIEEDEEVENDEEDDVNGGDLMREMVMRLSELSEDDFYGLRITLNHIASRHALLHSNDSGGGENRGDASELGGGGVDGEES